MKRLAFLLCFSFGYMFANNNFCLCYNSEICNKAHGYFYAYKTLKDEYEKDLNNGATDYLETLEIEYKIGLKESCERASKFLKRDKLLFEVFLLDEYNMDYKHYQKLCKEVNIQV